MFNNPYFDVFLLIVLILHMIVINDIKPKSGYLKETNVQGNIITRIKNVMSDSEKSTFSKIEDGIIYIYNSEFYTEATNVQKINIFNSNHNKLTIRKIQNTNDFNKDLYIDLYGFNIYREAEDNEPKIDIDIYLDTIQDRDNWITAIQETEDLSYGKQSDGSVVLNDIQTDIKKYLDKSKELEKIIYGDSSPKEVKQATSKLISLRSKLNNQIKKYENPKNLNNILKGDTLDVKDIKTCNCSLGKLRTTTMYLNAILPSIIIISAAIQYFNKNLYESWIYKKIAGITGKPIVSEVLDLFTTEYKVFLYSLFFIIAAGYHFYLMSYCQCSIPTQTQKGYSFFFMLFFPILIVVHALSKVLK